MAPAMRPALQLVLPRVGETCRARSLASKASGSAPYFSTLARSFASSAVKLPVICAWPPRIAPFDVRRGLDRARRARWRTGSCGAGFWRQLTGDGRRTAGRPWQLKVRLTTQPPTWLCDRPRRGARDVRAGHRRLVEQVLQSTRPVEQVTRNWLGSARPPLVAPVCGSRGWQSSAPGAPRRCWHWIGGCRRRRHAVCRSSATRAAWRTPRLGDAEADARGRRRRVAGWPSGRALQRAGDDLAVRRRRRGRRPRRRRWPCRRAVGRGPVDRCAGPLAVGRRAGGRARRRRPRGAPGGSRAWPSWPTC